jgi:PAS domain S-box-containing protein
MTQPLLTEALLVGLVSMFVMVLLYSHSRSRRNEAYLRALIQASPLAIISLDTDGNVLTWNPAAERIFGWTAEEVIGGPLPIVPPEGRDASLELRRRVADGEVVSNLELIRRRKDGTDVEVRLSTAPVVALGDAQGPIMATIEDISERRRAEERIAMLAQVSDTAPSSITVHDFEGNFLYANERTFDLHGYSREEFMAANLRDIDAPASQALIAERMRLIEQHGEATFEVQHYRRDGSTFPLEVNVKLVDWGGTPAMLSIGTDIEERKQAQELLAASEARFRALFENAPVGIFTTTSDGRALTVNPEMARILGLESPEDAVARYADLAAELYVRPERRDAFINALREKGGVENFEYEARTADGRVIWLSMNARITEWLDDDGFVIEGFTTDITERRRAEDAYARVCRMASELICVANIETATFVQVNPAFSAVLGYSEDELLSRPFLDFVHPDDVDGTVSVITEKLQQGVNVISFENRYRCKDGSYRYLEWNSHPVPAEGMTYAIAHDVTERRLAEAERERLMSAIEQTGEIVMITDADAQILYVNPAFEHCTGYTREEAIGRTPRFLRSGEHDDAFYGRLWSSLNAGQTWHGRFLNRRKDGTIYTEEATISPVCDTTGRVVNYVGVKRDISEQLAVEAERAGLERQFQQAQKLDSVGRLAGGIAHDLNNLLVPILGYSEILIEDFGDSRELSGPIEAIMQAGTRARDLVRQLLAFSRKQVLEFRPVDLNEVLSQFEGLLRSTIREDVRIELVPAPSLPLIHGDAGQLEQVIMNLAVNAQDAMPDGGTLTIETQLAHLGDEYAAAHDGTAPGEYVMLGVSDTGCGIDDNTREHIFEPFFSTKQDGGTGLGLATVYGIVKQHGGAIWVYSEPGRGATFKVYLPVAEDIAAPGPPPKTELGDLQGSETVLLVEDHDQVRELAEAILRRHGYNVLPAGNGEAALALMERYTGPLHLVLTDVVMPQMSGKALFERLAELHPGLRVLYMSGYTDNVIAHRGVIDGGVNFIQKPFAVQALAGKVRQVLDQDG